MEIVKQKLKNRTFQFVSTKIRHINSFITCIYSMLKDMMLPSHMIKYNVHSTVL